MVRYYLLFTLVGLGTGTIFALNSSPASDVDATVTSVPKEEDRDLTRLLERIDQLEKRLDALEVREPLIRQADSRTDPETGLGNPRPVPNTDLNEEQSPRTNHTNGQSWQFRLLNYRQTVENLEPAPKLVPRRVIGQPTTQLKTSGYRGI